MCVTVPCTHMRLLEGIVRRADGASGVGWRFFLAQKNIGEQRANKLAHVISLIIISSSSTTTTTTPPTADCDFQRAGNVTNATNTLCPQPGGYHVGEPCSLRFTLPIIACLVSTIRTAKSSEKGKRGCTAKTRTPVRTTIHCSREGSLAISQVVSKTHVLIIAMAPLPVP